MPASLTSSPQPTRRSPTTPKPRSKRSRPHSGCRRAAVEGLNVAAPASIPVSIDLASNGRQSEQEQRLLRYLDDLEAEAQRAKRRWVKPEDTERELNLHRG